MCPKWLCLTFVLCGLTFAENAKGQALPEIIKQEEKPPENPADLPPLKLFDRPYDVSIGTSMGIDMLNGTDKSNGGKASLTGFTSGVRLEAFRAMRTVEHTGEFELRIVAFPKYPTTRLINVSQMIYPGFTWHTRFVRKNESLNWIVGGGINSIPYYSNLAVTTVTMDGAISLTPYGGARLEMPGLESIYLRNIEGHVGIQFPLMTKGYSGSLGLWQRLRIVFDKPWMRADDKEEKRWFVGWIDVVNSSESSNLESQTQLSVAAWVFVKWRLDPK